MVAIDPFPGVARSERICKGANGLKICQVVCHTVALPGGVQGKQSFLASKKLVHGNDRLAILSCLESHLREETENLQKRVSQGRQYSDMKHGHLDRCSGYSWQAHIWWAQCLGGLSCLKASVPQKRILSQAQ